MICPACRTRGDLPARFPGYTLCGGCGSYLSPRTRVYGDGYWDEHGGIDGHRRLIEGDRLSWWMERIVRRGRILEVGCAPGALLDNLLARGDDAYGVDPTMEESDRVRRGEFPSTSWPGPFDAIVMLDVLEHMERPSDALCHARDLLVPGGSLYLQLPTLRDRTIEDRFWLAGEHTWIPTQRALTRTLALAGFSVVSTDCWHPGHEWTEAKRG